MLKTLPPALLLGVAIAANMAVDIATNDALALGVGDINVNSALYQRLDADIELLSSVPGELDDVSVRLAPAEAFRRIRLDRPAILDSIEFAVTTRADGAPIIKLSTAQAIREPFLSFLIEVDWAQGRMLREYTVLLDPPVTIAAQPPSPSLAESAVAVAPPASATAPRRAYPSDRYGPVKRRETLWNIARQVRPDGVSIQQMVLALFDSNPNAFIRGDIHLLKRGYVLNIPAAAAARRLDQRAAVAQMRRHNARLNARLRAAGARTIAEAPPDGAGTADRASPAPSPPAPSPRQDAPDGELSLLTPANAASSPASAAAENVSALRRELALESERASSLRQENEELKSRVVELEAVQRDMEELKRLLDVQNAEMAKLQSQLAAKTAAPAVPTPEPVPKPTPPPQRAADGGYVDMAIGYAGAALDYITPFVQDPTMLGIIGAVLLVLVALMVLIRRRRENVVTLDFDADESFDEAAERTERERLAAGKEKLRSGHDPQGPWSDDGPGGDSAQRPVLEAAAPAEAESAEEEVPPEFDLGDLGLPSADGTQATADDTGAETETTFDLSGLGLETEEESASDPQAAVSDSADDLGLDFALESSAPAADQSAASAETEAEPSAGIDLSDFKFDDDKSAAAGAAADSVPGPEVDAQPIDDSVAPAPTEADDALQLDSSGTFDAPADGDGNETSTKLDLAGAYIDMGDADGAKNILKEVIAEGDEAQKKRAEELMQQI